MYDRTFKIILLSNPEIDKSSMFPGYLAPQPYYQKTPGVEFRAKSLSVDGKKIKLQIWDIRGEERFRFLLSIYVRGARGGLFLYDITNYSSIAHIDDWLSVIRKEIKAENMFPILVVGIITDEKRERQVSTEEGKEIVKSRNLNGFIECNIKTGENVEKAFEALTRLMMAESKKNIKKKKNWADYSSRRNFKLKKRSKRVSPKIPLKPPLPPSPPPKPPGSPAMTFQGKKSFPYPIFNSRFLNWSRGARWIRCPNCRKKIVKENYFTHSCTKKLNDIAVQSPKTPVRLKRDIIGGMMQNLSGRAQSEQKSNFKSDSLSDEISRLIGAAGVGSNSQLKGEVQSFLQWIKDSEGLSGYINYYLQQNNTTIISELSKIYSELRQIFGIYSPKTTSKLPIRPPSLHPPLPPKQPGDPLIAPQGKESYQNQIINLLSKIERFWQLRNSRIIAVTLVQGKGTILYSTDKRDISVDVGRAISNWGSLNAQFVKISGVKYSVLRVTPEILVVSSIKGKDQILTAKDKDYTLILHIEPDGVDDSMVSPYIFTPPNPPDDFKMAPQVQVRAPLREKDPEEEIYCQYCGRELTKEEQFTHSCKKKP